MVFLFFSAQARGVPTEAESAPDPLPASETRFSESLEEPLETTFFLVFFF